MTKPWSDPSTVTVADSGADETRAAVLGRYIVIGRVGSGSMGVVLAAYDPDLDRKVALKLVRARGNGPSADARLCARLNKEAKAIARVSHPNLVSIYDVGLHGDQVFLAMEFLSGGTLREWLRQQKRPRATVVSTFVEIGRGLSAAHAQGLVHRDLKPENVLLDAAGRPKVVDFGLARLINLDAESQPGLAPTALTSSAAAVTPLETNLTATGSLAGTPAYMAPEQFTEGTIDARSDQFGFCVALYEALYGERPFGGNNVLEIASSVLAGSIRPAPKGTEVPSWLRRIVIRGLARNPDQRFPSMDRLVEALSRDPVAELKRRLLRFAAAALVLVAISVTAFGIISRRRQIDRAVDRHSSEAHRLLDQARRMRDRFVVVSSAAFNRFDALDAVQAESRWAEALQLRAAIRRQYARALQAAESAFLVDSTRADGRSLVADAIFERLLFELDSRPAGDDELLERLSLYDDGQRRQALERPGRVRFANLPPDTTVAVEEFARTPGGRQAWLSRREGLKAPISELELPPGSYRLRFASPGRAPILLPVLVGRAKLLELAPALPHQAAVPVGFVAVPTGEFLLGSDAEESYRRDFQHASPLHRVSGSAFLIKQHETTYREWIEYLRALPARERALRLPRAAAAGFQGELRLRALPGHDWELRMQPGTRVHTARVGQSIDYARSRLPSTIQDWRNLPVSGVSGEDARAYASWLRSTGRVANARLCTETEWERAAKGADGRPYPHGWSLQPGDANYDATWGGNEALYGPDVVGSYPISRSPFGVDDLSGNVWEWVQSGDDKDPKQTARGGAFAYDANSCRTEYREITERNNRSITAGVRICADLARR